MNDYINILVDTGLQEKEARTYMAMLRVGEASASEISKESGIKRPTTYLILEDLRKKGLVIKVPHAKKALYIAKSPEDFHQQVVLNAERLKRVIPTLRSVSHKGSKINTLYYEGIGGIKEALYYRLGELANTADVGFFAKDDGNIPNSLIDIYYKWNEKRESLNIRIGGVTPDNPTTREFQEKYPLTDMKIVPLEDYNSDISIEITEKFIRIIDGHELKAVIIENPRVVDAMRQILKLAQEKYQK